VAAWAAAGGRVIAAPGPSSVLAAVASAGIAGPRWAFEGFLPRSGRERRERLSAIAADERGAVVFEGPNRVAATLADLAAACGDDRPGAVCRELTKLHEQVARAPLGELARQAADGTIPARGEVVIVVGWGRGRGTIAGVADAREDALVTARARVEALVADGVARGEAARRVSKETGLARRALYGADAGSDAGQDAARD
jgi:16S rRNA (cytidine1402-2'-O)-methyltransferase